MNLFLKKAFVLLIILLASHNSLHAATKSHASKKSWTNKKLRASQTSLSPNKTQSVRSSSLYLAGAITEIACHGFKALSPFVRSNFDLTARTLSAPHRASVVDPRKPDRDRVAGGIRLIGFEW